MSVFLISFLVIVSILLIILLTSRFRLHAFVALFIVSLFLAVTTLPADKVVSTIKEGFGSTMASIGFLIILGAIIGITLDKTGGTVSIANFILKKTGESRSAVAIGITGFVTGLPIFCDSGYIILSGLAKSFSNKSKIPIAFMATVLACSLYSVHCLIPLHPGALAAAGIMNTNIGNMVLAGILFAIPAAIAAFLWSRFVVKGKDYPVAKEVTVDMSGAGRELPSAFLSFLPVVVPLLLITVKSLLGLIRNGGQNIIVKIFFFLGDPVMALSAGVILALLLVSTRNITTLNSIFSESISKAGPILIITAAGGMFGTVIKATGIGDSMGNMLAGTGLGIFVPFLIAAIMKIAQGSSTVAIITAASFVAPMLPVLGLGSDTGRLLATLSMGSGSMIISHANDSYFWVVSNFSDIDPGTSLKVYSSSTFVMGMVAFFCIWIASLIVL